MGSQRILFFLGQTERAMAACRQVRQSTPAPSRFWRPFTEHWVRYVCGETSDEDLIQLAKDSRVDQASAFHIVAIRRLGEGERAKARACFQKATAMALFGLADHDFSWIFLKRMELDPTWPPWIPMKTETPAPAK